MGDDFPIERILDANLNRAREGLRVCEELVRFALEDAALTRRCQRLRHDLDRLTAGWVGLKWIRARRVSSDPGHPAFGRSLRRHRHLKDVAIANFRRTEEALRVIEEYARLRSVRKAQRFGRLRFRVYDLEQKVLSRLLPLCDR
jgi:thiamine-phosphate pyrophosphorylase